MEPYVSEPIKELPVYVPKKARLLIERDGELIPCDYQYISHWELSSNSSIPPYLYVRAYGSGIVKPQQLSKTEEALYKSDEAYQGRGFHDFLVNLMNSVAKADFIQYDGWVMEEAPREYWNLFILKIPKPRKKVFVHRFSLYRHRDISRVIPIAIRGHEA